MADSQPSTTQQQEQQRHTRPTGLVCIHAAYTPLRRCAFTVYTADPLPQRQTASRAKAKQQIPGHIVQATATITATTNAQQHNTSCNNDKGIGDDETVVVYVCVHATGFCKEMWHAVIEDHAAAVATATATTPPESVQVMYALIDACSHGDSEEDPNPRYVWSTWAKEILQVVDALKTVIIPAHNQRRQQQQQLQRQQQQKQQQQRQQCDKREIRNGSCESKQTREALHVEFVGVGHSMGGGLLCRAQVVRPVFSSLILVEPIIFPPPPPRLIAPLSAQHDVKKSSSDKVTAVEAETEAPVRTKPTPLSVRALSRADGFDSRAAILTYLSTKALFRGWDPRALCDYADHGFRWNACARKFYLKCTPQMESKTFAYQRDDVWDHLPGLVLAPTLSRRWLTGSRGMTVSMVRMDSGSCCSQTKARADDGMWQRCCCSGCSTTECMPPLQRGWVVVAAGAESGMYSERIHSHVVGHMASGSLGRASVRRVRIPGSGHMAVMQKPSAVAALMVAVLDVRRMTCRHGLRLSEGEHASFSSL